MNIYLLELTYRDPTTLSATTLRYGTEGYMTLPSDTPANAWYEGRLKVPNDYECHTMRDGISGGLGQGGYGVAQLLNTDGVLDTLISEAFDGNQLRILWGSDGASYSTFQPLITGTMCQPQPSYKYFSALVRDYSELLDKPVSILNYMGNNVAGVGIEGTPDDLMGKSKPICFGRCYNITPAWVSQSGLIYQFHVGSAKAVDAVYTNGVAMTLDTTVGTSGDCATLAALQAASPGTGEYCTCLAMGLFKISGGSGTTITADVRGDNSGGVYVNSIAGIIQRYASNYVQWPRTNLAQYSEDFTQSAWTATGLTRGSSTAYSGLSPLGTVSLFAYTETGSATHNVVQNMTTATGMWLYSIYVIPGSRTTFRLKLVDHGNSANYCAVDFDLVAASYSNVTSAGAAVGPQYTATGFITAGGIIAYPNGAYRLWVCGQPNSALTSIDFTLSALSGGTETYAGANTFSCGGAMIETGFSNPHIYTGPTTTTPVTGYDPTMGLSLNSASFTALATGVPYEVGFYVAPGDTTTGLSMINALAASGGVILGFDRSGNFYGSQFTKPSSGATPVATFTKSQILPDTIDWVAPFSDKDGTPPFRLTLSGVKNWTVLQKSTVASSLWTTNPTFVSWLGQEWRTAKAEDLSTLYLHPLACEVGLTTYIANITDLFTEAQRLLTLYKQGNLLRLTFTVKIDQCPLAVIVGSIVQVQYPRWGIAGGRNFVVIGIAESHKDGKVTLEVMG